MRKLLALFLFLPAVASAQVTWRMADQAGASYRTVPGVRETRAVDLTEAAAWRRPFAVDSSGQFRPTASSDYTFCVWVRVPEGSRQPKGGAVIATTADKARHEGGFTLGAADNGSWYAGMTDTSGLSLWYEPTVERQPLNDGQWHQLAVTCDRRRGKAAFYYDGCQTALYNLKELGSLDGSFRLRIGGSDDSEWNAFNGCVDFAVADTTVWSPARLSAAFRNERPQAVPLTDPFLPRRLDTLRLMGFNIWHGGNETGAVAGPRRVADIIRESGAEVVGLIETYGSGARIADELGYYFYLHSSNLSILSRYPIVSAEDIFHPFNCSAVELRVSATQTIRYINLWLHYLPSTDRQLRDGVPVDSILRGEWSTRASELKQILAEATSSGFIGDEVPTFVSGDFNIASHLDWTRATKKQHGGYVIPWPTSRLMEEAGFRDSFRERWPNPVTHPGNTWSPVSKEELQYRIDFIYYRGPGVRVVDSRMIDTHPVRFPSDHAALLSVFALD